MKIAERTGIFGVDQRNALDKLKAPPEKPDQIKNPLTTLTDARPFGISRSDRIRLRPPIHLSEITGTKTCWDFKPGSLMGEVFGTIHCKKVFSNPKI
jgi:hypothetical protein